MGGTYPVTYEARDVNNRSAKLMLTITVEPQAAIRSIVSSVSVEDTAGVPRFADLPQPSGGPTVEVTGSLVLCGWRNGVP